MPINTVSFRTIPQDQRPLSRDVRRPQSRMIDIFIRYLCCFHEDVRDISPARVSTVTKKAEEEELYRHACRAMRD
jgi:hypothetical protein